MRQFATDDKRRTIRELWPLAAVLALVVVTAGVLAIAQPSLHDRTPFQSRVRTATPEGDVLGQSNTVPPMSPAPRAAAASDRIIGRAGTAEAVSVPQGSSGGAAQTGPPPGSLSSEAPGLGAPTALVPPRDVAPSTNARPSNATPPPFDANQPTVPPTPPRQPSVPPLSPTAPVPTADPEPTEQASEPTPTPTPTLLDDIVDLLPLGD